MLLLVSLSGNGWIWQDLDGFRPWNRLDALWIRCSDRVWRDLRPHGASAGLEEELSKRFAQFRVDSSLFRPSLRRLTAMPPTSFQAAVRRPSLLFFAFFRASNARSKAVTCHRASSCCCSPRPSREVAPASHVQVATALGGYPQDLRHWLEPNGWSPEELDICILGATRSHCLQCCANGLRLCSRSP